MGNVCQATTSPTASSLDADLARIEEEKRQQQIEEEKRLLKLVRTDINLQIHDHAAGVFGKEISHFGAMLLGTVQELKAEVLSKNIIAAGTRPEEVAISFGGERVASPRLTTLEGLGVAEGGTLEIKVDGEAREAREARRCTRTDEDIKRAVNAWCDDPVGATDRFGPIGEWDTSQVTSMRYLFRNKRGFNDDISQWDVSGVTDMRSVFSGASSFNQPVEGWSTGRVTDMHSMFLRASSFNQHPSWARSDAF